MKNYTTEEILQSLKDDQLQEIFTTSLSSYDINQLIILLEHRDREKLALMLTSNLTPDSVEAMKHQNILEEGVLSNIGLAHLSLYLKHCHSKKHPLQKQSIKNNRKRFHKIRTIITLKSKWWEFWKE